MKKIWIPIAAALALYMIMLIDIGNDVRAGAYDYVITDTYMKTVSKPGCGDEAKFRTFYNNTMIDEDTLEYDQVNKLGRYSRDWTTDTAGTWEIQIFIKDGVDTIARTFYYVISDTMDTNLGIGSGDPAATVYAYFTEGSREDEFKASGCGAGEGDKLIYLYTVDTLNNVRIQNVIVTMKNTAGTDELGVKITGRDYDQDTVAFNGIEGNTYPFLASSSGYLWETAKTVTAGATPVLDSIVGYPFDPGDPGDPTLKRIYGWLLDPAGHAIANAIISLTLTPPRATRVIPHWTSSGKTVKLEPQFDTTNSSGYWNIDVMPIDSLTPAGCTYNYKVELDGRTLRWHTKNIEPTGMADANIADL